MRSFISILGVVFKRKRFTDHLREAIEKCQMTRHRIGVDTEIDQASLSSFMLGTTGLTTEDIDKLCEYLDLQLVEDKSKRKGKARWLA